MSNTPRFLPITASLVNCTQLSYSDLYCWTALSSLRHREHQFPHQCVLLEDKCRIEVQVTSSSYLIWLHGGCNGSGGSHNPQTSVATDTGPDTPRLLYSTPPGPPQTELWLLRSRLYRTTSLLLWRSAVVEERHRIMTERNDGKSTTFSAQQSSLCVVTY